MKKTHIMIISFAFLFVLGSVMVLASHGANRLPTEGGDSGSWDHILNTCLDNFVDASCNIDAAITDGTVVSADIAADTIVAADIATGAVDTAEILDGAITNTDLAADTIDGTALADTITLDSATTTLQRNSGIADVLAIDSSGAGTLNLNLVDGALRTAGTNRINNDGTAAFTGLTVVATASNLLLLQQGGTDLFNFDTSTVSSVNGLTFKSKAAGNNPSIDARGSDTNIGVNIIPKGTGGVQINGGTGMRKLQSGSAACTGDPVTVSFASAFDTIPEIVVCTINSDPGAAGASSGKICNAYSILATQFSVRCRNADGTGDSTSSFSWIAIDI